MKLQNSKKKSSYCKGNYTILCNVLHSLPHFGVGGRNELRKMREDLICFGSVKKQGFTHFRTCKPLILLVGGTGFEPVTSTV